VRKLWVHLTYGTLLCLAGFVTFYLSRKLSSVPSSDSLSSLPEPLTDEWASWKRRTELELETQLTAVKSALGRLDREGRKKKDAQEGQERPGTDGLEVDDQGKLNAILAERIHGVRR